MDSLSYQLVNIFRTGNPVLDILIALLIPFLILKIKDIKLKLPTINREPRYSRQIRWYSEWRHPEAKLETGSQYRCALQWYLKTQKDVIDRYIVGNKYNIYFTNNTTIYIQGIKIHIKNYTDPIKYQCGDKECTELCQVVIYTLSADSSEKIDIFIDDVLEKHTNYEKNEADKYKYIYQFKEYDMKDNQIYYIRHKFDTQKSFDNIFFPEKDTLLDVIKQFKTQTGIYEKSQHKLTLLLSGLPGCGKSSIIKALAKELDRNILQLYLSNFKKKSQFEDIAYGSHIKLGGDSKGLVFNTNNPITVFEDITDDSDIVLQDKYKTKKSNNHLYHQWMMMQYTKDLTEEQKKFYAELSQTEEDDLTLSVLLNWLDGNLEQPGRVVIITTNNPEKLHPVLVRPGRITMHIHFDYATEESIQQQTEYYFGRRLLEIPKKVRACDLEMCYIQSGGVWDRYVELVMNISTDST